MVTPRILLAFLVALFACGIALPQGGMAKPGASGVRTLVTASWVEEWDPAAQRWVRVEEAAGAAVAAPAVLQGARGESAPVALPSTTYSFVYPAAQPRPAAMQPALAQYGPFRVLDATRAALVGSTDIASPRHFDAMMRDYPGLAVLEMIDAPGTSHDLANLALGRKIRAAGLETHVPARGSVRSGAVELFLAGKRQTIAPGATFAVHSWLDTRGLEPRHFAEDAPENRLYLDYYAEMGMSPEHARAFYAMTNSVPHSGALWLDAATMQRWIAPLANDRRRDALVEEAQLVWQSVVDPGERFALATPAPRLAYAECLPVALARLDSVALFP